jgi:hypothetical protein
LDELGAIAISRCKPTNSVADVSTFLGELLKDGLPSIIGYQLWKDRADAAKAAGSEYLNAQFGWLPIISDIQKFGKAVSHADTVLAQYERDSGRVVRRRYNFPAKKDSSVLNLGPRSPNTLGVYDGNFFNLNRPFGDVIRVREKTQRQWFSGAFTYYLPTGNSAREKMAYHASLADKLFGISLTPETLWNLSPWSWAIDWFSNTGDVVSNLQDFATGGLIMPYGYMMEHTIVKDTYTLSDPNFNQKYKDLTVSPLVLVTETKIRRGANPYGFGVSWNGLSSFQASILAALGISRR